MIVYAKECSMANQNLKFAISGYLNVAGNAQNFIN